MSCSPRSRAASCTSANCVPANSGSLGLTSSANIPAPGTSSCSSPSPFGADSASNQLIAGHVAARPVEAGDQARPDRVSAAIEDDRDRRGRRFGRQSGAEAAGRGNHGHLAADQFGRQRRQSIALPVRPTVLDRDILALDIAGFASSPCRNAAIRAAERLPATGR